MFVREDEENNPSVIRFQSMLKTNDIFFFDSIEFEDIINHYLSIGIFPIAKKAMKMGLSQHPDSVDLKLLKIEILIMEDKLEEAETMLNGIHLLEPSNEEVFIQKANLLSKQGHHRKAITVLKNALHVASEQGEIYSLIGMELLEMEEYEEAVYFFIKAVDNDKDELMLFYVIYCFNLLGKRNQAIQYLNNLLEERPYAEEAWYYLGKEFIQLKEYKKALAALDFAIISDDTFLGAYLEKGKVLERMHKYEEALETYHITTELDDPTDFAFLGLGRCYEKLGKDSLALKYFHLAHEQDPLGDRALIAISDFYERKGNYHKALECMTKALNTDDLNARFWKRYGRLNHALNFLEEAEHGYNMALENGNYELDIWIKRGDILISFGHFKAALKNFEDAAEFYRGPELEYRFAGIYYSLYDSDKGNHHLEKALASDASKVSILQQKFPRVFARKSVSARITKYRNSRPQGELL